jgi:hypothetical protein
MEGGRTYDEREAREKKGVGEGRRERRKMEEEVSRWDDGGNGLKLLWDEKSTAGQTSLGSNRSRSSPSLPSPLEP